MTSATGLRWEQGLEGGGQGEGRGVTEAEDKEANLRARRAKALMADTYISLIRLPVHV